MNFNIWNIKEKLDKPEIQAKRAKSDWKSPASQAKPKSEGPSPQALPLPALHRVAGPLGLSPLAGAQAARPGGGGTRGGAAAGEPLGR